MGLGVELDPARFIIRLPIRRRLATAKISFPFAESFIANGPFPINDEPGRSVEWMSALSGWSDWVDKSRQFRPEVAEVGEASGAV